MGAETKLQFAAWLVAWLGGAVFTCGVVVFSADIYYSGFKAKRIAWYGAAAFIFITCPVSLLTIWGHLIQYRQPLIQCYVVRILWLVPLYSVGSWLSLRFHDFALFFGAFRDVYEAYVIYCFFYFLLALIGGEEAVRTVLRTTSVRRVAHPSPLGWCLKPWLVEPLPRPSHAPSVSPRESALKHSNSGDSSTQSPFMAHCQLGVLQYVVLKCILTIISFILELAGLFGEGEFSLKKGYIYISFVGNVSQAWAMYCLVQFYHVCKGHFLQSSRPVAKLLAVKSVVFFTYWQSCAIMFLHWKGLLPEAIETNGEHWSDEDVAKGLQDYLICIEMLIGAFIFREVFSHKEYKHLRVRSWSQSEAPLTHQDDRLSLQESRCEGHVQTVGLTLHVTTHRSLAHSPPLPFAAVGHKSKSKLLGCPRAGR